MELLLRFALTSTALLLVASFASLALRRRSAATRGLVWSVALLGAIAVLPILLLAPRVPVAILPPTAAAESEIAIQSTREPTAGPVSSTARAEAIEPLPSRPLPTSPSGIAEEITAPRRAPSLAVVLPLLWIAGMVAVLARLAAGVWSVARMVRAASTPEPALARRFERLCERLGMSDRVRLCESDALDVPVTVQLRASCILVPPSVRNWSRERQEVVLLHELAHVRRADCRVQMLGWVAVALQWFNPLAWLALARFGQERERACDDMVLAAGVRPSCYADHLLAVARSLTAGARLPVAGIAFADRGRLGARIRSILDPATGRTSPTRSTTVFVSLTALSLIVPLAALQPVQPPQEPPLPPSPPVAIATPHAALPSTPAPASLPAPASAPGTPAALQQSMPAIDQLVTMKIHGITPEWIDEMGGLVGTLDFDDLVTLKIHGASPEYVRQMHGVFGDSLDADDLVTGLIHGMDPEWIGEMRDVLGPGDFDDFVTLKIHGTSPEYVRGMDAALGDDLELDDVVTGRIHGISPELVRAARARLGEDIDFDEVVTLQIHGITPESIDELQGLFPGQGLDSDDVVTMAIHGITPKLVRDLHEAGYTDLTVDELVQIKIHGTDKIMLRRSGGQR